MGYLRKDPASKKFSLGPWSLELGMKYVQTSPLVLGGNPFLHSLNRNCQETCSLAEPDGGHGVRGAFRHAQGNVREHAGRHAPAAVLHGGGARGAVAAGSDVAHGLLERSDRRSHTAATITGMDALLAELEFARRHVCTFNGEFYGRHHRQRRRAGCRRHPLGAVNVSVPSSRWSFEQAQAVFGPQVVETAHAISVSRTLGRSYPFYELEPPGGALRATPISVAGEA